MTRMLDALATRMRFARSLRASLTDCATSGWRGAAEPALTGRTAWALTPDWAIWGHDGQLPPIDDPAGSHWSNLLLLGGRGAGKTRAGAEWVRAMALGLSPFTEAALSPIALIGETHADVREVMVEGVSGLLGLNGGRGRPRYEPSRRRLVWPNGAVAQLFSAEEPDSLRGPQFAAAWADEFAKWRRPGEAWDMLQFGLRVGPRPRTIVTTTPRPIALLHRMIGDPRTVTRRARTHDNAGNLSPAFMEAVVARYEGTRLGRQELDGEIVEERSDALWTREMIEAARVEIAPPLARIVVAVDPPASSGARASACGIVAAGITEGEGGIVHLLADASLEAARPAAWAEAAIGLYRRLEADALVVEVNQGGEMATSVLRAADPGVPVTSVRATRGKYLRAEPAAQLTEQGRVRFAGAFPALEDELCDFGPGGLSNGRSPDRLDAFVWAVTALVGGGAEPRMRAL